MPIPTEAYAVGVTLALSAFVAWLVTRLTLARWMHRAFGNVAARGTQAATEQTVRCTMCGRGVADVSEGIEHVDEVHGLRLGREDAARVLEGVG